jgi:hypothetical protein
MSETASNSLNALDITAMCQKVIEDCVAGKIELIAVPDNLKPLELLLKWLRITSNRSLSESARKGVELYKVTWMEAERKHLKALMRMNRKSFDVSKTSLLKRLISKTMMKFMDKQARLLYGLYLLQNWHPSIHHEFPTIPWSSSQLFSTFHPLQLLPVCY